MLGADLIHVPSRRIDGTERQMGEEHAVSHHQASAPGRTGQGLDLLGADDTVIVGAGIAGLACARRLFEAQRPFVVISEDVGGRLQRSRDGSVSLGAYYVRADYTQVNRYARSGRRINDLVIRRHDEKGAHGYWDSRLMLHLPQAARFLAALAEFRLRYDALKQRSIHIGQAAAVRADSTLDEWYHMPAAEFIREHRIGDLARWYLAPGLHGTAFISVEELNAFTLLLGALPILVPTYEFTPQLDRLTGGFEDAIVLDTVAGVGLHGARYDIETKANGILSAAHLVIATPTDTAKHLLDLPATKRPVSVHSFLVSGSLRGAYQRADMHLFPDTDSTFAIARQHNGTVLVASREEHTDLGKYFTQWRVIEHKHWNPAFHIIGDELLEANPGPNLYLVGDHNIVGLEDAYLTGLYAANRIIATTHTGRATTRTHASTSPGRRSMAISPEVSRR